MIVGHIQVYAVMRSLYSSLLLALLLSSCFYDTANSNHLLECDKFRYEAAHYSECRCGEKTQDVIDLCETPYTYYPPRRWQRILGCDLACKNGGTPTDTGTEQHCKCPDGFYGTCCEVETNYCGDIFLAPEGEFSSPPDYQYNLPEYPANRRCVWRITTDPGLRIALGVKDSKFDIEPGMNYNTCDNDYVSVYDGLNKDGKRVGTFCGNTTHERAFKTIHSKGRHLYIEFQSNDIDQRKGFTFQYTTFRRGYQCGPRTRFEKEVAIIESPQYPLEYVPQTSCKYDIIVKPNHDLRLTPMEIKLPASQPNCTDDGKLVVRKKVGVSKKAFVEEIITLCGRDLYDLPYFTVPGNDLGMTVVLDFSSRVDLETGRFKLQYSQIPVYEVETL